jgi:hypothetical protein
VIDHPVRARIAEILVVRMGRTGEIHIRGSGYLVSPGWVLTAGHVVLDATSIGVWLGARSMLAPEAGVVVDPEYVLMIPGADLALLPVAGTRMIRRASQHYSVGWTGTRGGPCQWRRLDARALSFAQIQPGRKSGCASSITPSAPLTVCPTPRRRRMRSPWRWRPPLTLNRSTTLRGRGCLAPRCGVRAG